MDWTPQNWAEVQRHPQREKITKDARDEMCQIHNTSTGRLATESEIAAAHRAGQKILPAKMVYKLKYTTVTINGVRKDIPHK